AGRPIEGECFFCHANRVRPLEGYSNRYAEPVFEGYAIGCERCHGPGAEHVKNPGNRDPATGVDYTIVNPRHLGPKLRAAVCEQCHLAGDVRVVRRGRGIYDFRPGLPLEEFWSVFLREAEADQPRKAVNHVEQMYLSTCFSKSEEKSSEGRRKLGCTSCHDPHRKVEAPQRVAYYRARCLDCHQQRGCSIPEATRRLTSKDDSCIDCHMPKYPSADIAHNASRDHRIIRRPDKDTLPGSKAKSELSPSREAAAQSGRIPRLRSFYHGALDAEGKETQRDQGLAIVRIMRQLMSQRRIPPPEMGQQAVSLLDSALTNDP